MVHAGVCAEGKTRLKFVARNVKINAEVSDKDFVEEPLPPVWDVIEGPMDRE